MWNRKCGNCGGKIHLCSANGELHELYKNVFVKVPNDVQIPRCKTCGVINLTPLDAERVDEACKYILKKLVKEKLSLRAVA